MRGALKLEDSGLVVKLAEGEVYFIAFQGTHIHMHMSQKMGLHQGCVHE